jgi:two-component system response regulator FixJ
MLLRECLARSRDKCNQSALTERSRPIVERNFGLLKERSVIYVVDNNNLMHWLYQEMLRELEVTLKIFMSASQFLDSYSPGSSECLICDVHVPEAGGRQMQRELLQAGPCLPVICVSAQPEVSLVVNAIKAGAFDFLEKPLNGVRLQQTVRNALEHSANLHDARLQSEAQQARLALLTPREREIVEGVVAGLSSREISSELGISVRTVENHRARIVEKLHVNSTVELVHLICNRKR